MLTRLVNGKRLEMTPEEETAFEDARTPSLEQAKEQKLIAIEEKAQQVVNAGMSFSGGRIRADDGAVALILGAGIKDPASRKVRVGRGQFVDVTPQNIDALQSALHDFRQAILDNEAALSAQVQAATNITEVEAVNMETGWPE